MALNEYSKVGIVRLKLWYLLVAGRGKKDRPRGGSRLGLVQKSGDDSGEMGGLL